MRLDSYGAGAYLFPGYVNQFKNVILPALAIVVVHYLFGIGYRYRVMVSVVLIGLALLGLLGTGNAVPLFNSPSP